MSILHKPRRQGFTIVELLIVIVVIGVLATITIVAYNGIQTRAALASIKTSLQSASKQLEIDNQINGSYPATKLLANSGNGLSEGGEVSFQYTYTSAANTYCLTATSSRSSVATYHITNTSLTPTVGACTGHADTGGNNLVNNGLGEKGNNTNFTSFTFDGTDASEGSQGSFVTPSGTYNFYISTDFMPIDKSSQYILRGWARQRTAGVTTSKWYLALAPYDVDKKLISPERYMYRPGTTTTLSQPLSTGDTVIHLSSISLSWYDTAGTATHNRSFIFWNYTDSTGKTWAPETYSQNTWYSDIYNGGVGAIDRTNNTITLNKPWPGQSYPAGHPVSNGSAGGTFMYAAAVNSLVTESWQEWVSPTITGTVAGGLNSAVTSFPLATESVRIAIGVNSGSPPTTSRQGFSGIRFYDSNP